MAEGILLHTEATGSGRPVVLVHGFSQTARSWRDVVAALSKQFMIIAVDAPGHGLSGEVHTALQQGAAILGETCGPAIYVGYSMGGRLALHLAVQRPDLVEALVLVGATPGIVDPVERAARRASDERLARRIEDIGVDSFVEEWLQNPLFSGIRHDPADRADRRRNTASGLASSLRLAGTGTQRPLWDHLSTLTMPVLLVTGADDARFSAIAEQMATAIGSSAEHRTVPGAGHSAHLEQPLAFAAILERWLAALPPRHPGTPANLIEVAHNPQPAPPTPITPDPSTTY